MMWLILTVVLSSCTFPINMQGYVEEGLGMNVDEAWKQTDAFAYIREDVNYWKSPMEFEADGGGDCEDFAVYMMYLLGNESMLVLVQGKTAVHALVWYDGQIMEPQIYGAYVNNAVVVEWIAWSEAMGWATEGGRKSLTFQ